MKPEHFEVLRKVEKNPESTQRELAKELGLSLGKLNYCLKALKDKGGRHNRCFISFPNSIVSQNNTVFT